MGIVAIQIEYLITLDKIFDLMLISQHAVVLYTLVWLFLSSLTISSGLQSQLRFPPFFKLFRLLRLKIVNQQDQHSWLSQYKRIELLD